MKKWLAVLAVAVMVSFAVTAQAWAGITVDGDLSDWGINLPDFTKPAGVYGIDEDYVGSNGEVGPGYGGQGYDAEALYFTRDASNGYIAIVTGFPQAGRADSRYAPNGWIYAGDIAMSFDGMKDVYEYGIQTSSDAVPQNGIMGGTPGDLWRVSTWSTSNEGTSFSSYYQESNPASIKSVTDLSPLFSGTLAYVKTADVFDRYIMEYCFPLNAIQGVDWSKDVSLALHWTQSCGNDAIMFEGSIPTSVPEPMSMTLFGLGAAALMVRRFRKKA